MSEFTIDRIEFVHNDDVVVYELDVSYGDEKRTDALCLFFDPDTQCYELNHDGDETTDFIKWAEEVCDDDEEAVHDLMNDIEERMISAAWRDLHICDFEELATAAVGDFLVPSFGKEIFEKTDWIVDDCVPGVGLGPHSIGVYLFEIPHGDGCFRVVIWRSDDEYRVGDEDEMRALEDAWADAGARYGDAARAGIANGHYAGLTGRDFF